MPDLLYGTSYRIQGYLLVLQALAALCHRDAHLDGLHARHRTCGMRSMTINLILTVVESNRPNFSRGTDEYFVPYDENGTKPTSE